MKMLVNLFLAICALAVLSTANFAEESNGEKYNHWKGKMGHEMSFDKIFVFKSRCILKFADKIGLSDEQVKKIKELEYNLEKSSVKQESEIKLIALDIKEEIHKDEINEKTINSLIDKKYALESEKSKEGIQAYANLKKIVTKEQLKKLEASKDCGKMCECNKARKTQEKN